MIDKEKTTKIVSRILLALAGLIVLALVAGIVYGTVTYIRLDNMAPDPTNSPVPTSTASATAIATNKATPTPTAEPTPTPEPVNDVINIMVIGYDAYKRGNYKNARSDVMIILTIDEKNDEIKMTTFMRDIHIDYEDIGYYNKKLNGSLQYYDHPDGVVKTIEENFDVDIDYYMMADYWDVAEIIDILGGIKIRLNDAEISATNDVLAYQNNHNEKCTNKWEGFIPHDPGILRLNGRQAVAYMRVRKIDSDFGRKERQYDVLQILKEDISNMSLDEVIKILNKLPDIIMTDMSANEILSMTKLLYSMKDHELQTARVPFDDTYEYKNNSLEIDFEQNIHQLHEYMYE